MDVRSKYVSTIV